MPKAKRDRWASRHDSQKVDLVFVVDCTGSMGPYISQVQKHIRYISETVSRTAFDVHLGLIEYRDHPPQEQSYIVRSHPFTAELSEMKANVDQMRASGGGDSPEAVADGLHAVVGLAFRQDATKVAVLICDAPPHGLHLDHDRIGEQCPFGHDPMKICQQMVEKEITLYCAGCEPALLHYRDFFIGLAHKTGGTYVPIKKSNTLAKTIINGCLQEISSEKIMGYVDDFVKLKRKGKEETPANVDQLADDLQNYLNMTNNKVERLLIDGKEADMMTDLGRAISRTNTLKQARKLWESARAKPDFQRATLDEDFKKTPEITLSPLQPVSRLHIERLLTRSLGRQRIPTEHSMEDVDMK